MHRQRAGRTRTFRRSASSTLAGSLVPPEVKVGDPLTLTLTLRGEGTLDAARAPDLTARAEVTDRFRVYEATEETRDGARLFNYSLRPLKPGEVVFPAIPVSYFDVDKEQYVTLQTQPISLAVKQAERIGEGEIAVAPAARSGGTSVELGRWHPGQHRRPGGAARSIGSAGQVAGVRWAAGRRLRRHCGGVPPPGALSWRRGPAMPASVTGQSPAATAGGASRDPGGPWTRGRGTLGFGCGRLGRRHGGAARGRNDVPRGRRPVEHVGRRGRTAAPDRAPLETCDGARYGASADGVRGLATRPGVVGRLDTSPEERQAVADMRSRTAAKAILRFGLAALLPLAAVVPLAGERVGAQVPASPGNL